MGGYYSGFKSDTNDNLDTGHENQNEGPANEQFATAIYGNNLADAIIYQANMAEINKQLAELQEIYPLGQVSDLSRIEFAPNECLLAQKVDQARSLYNTNLAIIKDLNTVTERRQHFNNFVRQSCELERSDLLACFERGGESCREWTLKYENCALKLSNLRTE